MYGVGKAGSLLTMTTPVGAGSLTYDFSTQVEVWDTLARSLVTSVVKFDTVDTAQEPYIVKFGHFSYYPLASGRYYPYTISASGVKWPVIGFVFEEGMRYGLKYTFKAYALDSGVPTSLTVQFWCSGRHYNSYTSVTSKKIQFIGQSEFVQTEEPEAFTVEKQDVYSIWMYAVSTA